MGVEGSRGRRCAHFGNSCPRRESTASENYRIGKICDYLAGIEANTKIIGNPARKQANAAVREAQKALAAAERGLAVLLAGQASLPPPRTPR